MVHRIRVLICVFVKTGEWPYLIFNGWSGAESACTLLKQQERLLQRKNGIAIY
jgi:hypothetical protein